MPDIYGVVDQNHVHHDVSLSEVGAKQYATAHGYTKVTARRNNGFHVDVISEKINGKWHPAWLVNKWRYEGKLA